MRTALEWAIGHDECLRDEHGGDPSEDGDSPMTAAMRVALDGTAGRALAERVTLWRELERRAQTIRQGHDTIDGGCHCGICELSRKLAAVDAKEPTE